MIDAGKDCGDQNSINGMLEDLDNTIELNISYTKLQLSKFKEQFDVDLTDDEIMKIVGKLPKEIIKL